MEFHEFFDLSWFGYSHRLGLANHMPVDQKPTCDGELTTKKELRKRRPAGGISEFLFISIWQKKAERPG